MILNWVQLGCLFMFLGVLLSTFGWQSLKQSKISQESLNEYFFGIILHIIHAFALLIVAWLTTISSDPKIHYAGLYFLLGILLFSGGQYLLALTELKWLKVCSVAGSLSFLCGWYLMIHGEYLFLRY